MQNHSAVIETQIRNVMTATSAKTEYYAVKSRNNDFDAKSKHYAMQSHS